MNTVNGMEYLSRDQNLSWDNLGHILAFLGTIFGSLEPSWAHHGTILGQLGTITRTLGGSEAPEPHFEQQFSLFKPLLTWDAENWELPSAEVGSWSLGGRFRKANQKENLTPQPERSCPRTGAAG